MTRRGSLGETKIIGFAVLHGSFINPGIQLSALSIRDPNIMMGCAATRHRIVIISFDLGDIPVSDLMVRQPGRRSDISEWSHDREGSSLMQDAHKGNV
jgi:hypothetical protein